MGFFANIAEKARYGLWQLKNTAFQFREGNMLYNLKKVSTIVTVTNGLLSNIDLVLKGIERTDNKGLVRKIAEKYTQKTLFNNDFSDLLKKTGLGGLISNNDKTGIIKGFTGFDKGIIQRISGINKSFEVKIPTFGSLFPHFELN
jgi:hypothetical protein